MFVQIDDDVIINTDHIIYVDTYRHVIEDINKDRYDVDSEYWDKLLKSFSAINVKARP